MDSGKFYGSCTICGKTMSAHINVSKPVDHPFGHPPKKEKNCRAEDDCECTFPHCPYCGLSDLKFVNAPGVGSQEAMFCNNCHGEV